MEIRKHTKTLLSAIITIVLSLCIIAGSTFALFMSSDKVDVTVKSGTVKITANVDETTLKVYSKDVEQTATDMAGAHLFENGGTASFDDDYNLVLERVTPGDKAEFNVTVKNESNVNILYRTHWAVSGDLSSALTAYVDGEEIVSNSSEWIEWDITNGYAKTLKISIELPMSVGGENGDEYQDQQAKISYSVEAVQANADLPDEWDGTIDTAWYDPNKTEFSLSTAEQLAGLAALVNEKDDAMLLGVEDEITLPVNFEGATIKLISDVDLYAIDEKGNRVSFDPIGFGYDVVFKGAFDGQGHTISNLYQSGWDLGLSYGTQGGGLFASVVDATIKNLNIDNAEVVMECVDMGIVVGYSYGTCTYENITVSNSLIANYQRYTGGVVGEVNGTQTFKNVDVVDTTISSLWGDFDCSLGGIIGGKYGEANVTFEDCDVACELNAYNDVTSSYQWYAYRRAGMLIGNSEETTKDGDRTVASASYLTAKNCTVTYGNWINYTYCEFAAGGSWPYVRVQAGYSSSAYSNPRYGVPNDANGVKPVDDNHAHHEGEDHNVLLVFNQLYGGGQGVYGCETHDGVTVNYPDGFVKE